MFLAQTRTGVLRTPVRSVQPTAISLKEHIVDGNFIVIRTGTTHIAGSGDRQCKRADCIFPSPTIRFDLDGRRGVALWIWVGVQMTTIPNGVRMMVLPTLRIVPISFN